MIKKIQCIFAVIITIIGISLTFLVVYYAFIFPKTIRMWQEQDKALTIFEHQLVQFSKFCTSYGMLLIPVYSLMTIAGFIWLVVALKRNQSEAI